MKCLLAQMNKKCIPFYNSLLLLLIKKSTNTWGLKSFVTRVGFQQSTDLCKNRVYQLFRNVSRNEWKKKITELILPFLRNHFLKPIQNNMSRMITTIHFVSCRNDCKPTQAATRWSMQKGKHYLFVWFKAGFMHSRDRDESILDKVCSRCPCKAVAPENYCQSRHVS